MSSLARLLIVALLALPVAASGQSPAQKPEEPVRSLGNWEGGRPHEITAITFHPNGKLFATASMRGNVFIWDAVAGKPVHKLKRQRGSDFVEGKVVHNALPHPRGAHTVCFSPDGKTLASGGADGDVVLWDVATGEKVNEFGRHPDPVTCVAFSPDGALLAVGGYRSFVCLWEIKTDQLVRKLEGHEDRVTSVSFSPDGALLVTGGITRWVEEVQRSYINFGPADIVRLWDVKTGKELRKFSGRGSVVAFSPDGKLVAAAGALHLVDQSIPGELGIDQASLVHVWDVTTGKERLQLRDEASAVSVTPDSRFLVVSWGTEIHCGYSWRRGGTLKFFDLSTGKEAFSLKEVGTCTVAAVSPNGKLLACGSPSGEVFLCELPELK